MKGNCCCFNENGDFFYETNWMDSTVIIVTYKEFLPLPF